MRNYPVIELEGKTYVSEATAADLLHRSIKLISNLTRIGNTVRIMRSKKVGSAILIPEEELFLYPFTRLGPRSTRRIYHYNEKFEQVPCEACSTGMHCPKAAYDA